MPRPQCGLGIPWEWYNATKKGGTYGSQQQSYRRSTQVTWTATLTTLNRGRTTQVLKPAAMINEFCIDNSLYGADSPGPGGSCINQPCGGDLPGCPTGSQCIPLQGISICYGNCNSSGGQCQNTLKECLTNFKQLEAVGGVALPGGDACERSVYGCERGFLGGVGVCALGAGVRRNAAWPGCWPRSRDPCW